MDKITEVLLTALKQALAEGTEQRLYRSGKLTGLFPGRTGANGDAAAQAVRDGLLDVTRTEARGKTTVEWVRLTPRGIAFLNEHESPVRALRELRAVLDVSRAGVPAWIEEIRQGLRTLDERLTEEMHRVVRRLEALSQRAEEALRRLEGDAGLLPDNVAAVVPWAPAALAYLDQRSEANAPGPCPFPELFAALAEEQPDLTVTGFHDGLRRLRDVRLVQLLPHDAGPDEMSRPEFALLDGAALLYYVGRSAGSR